MYLMASYVIIRQEKYRTKLQRMFMLHTVRIQIQTLYTHLDGLMHYWLITKCGSHNVLITHLHLKLQLPHFHTQQRPEAKSTSNHSGRKNICLVALEACWLPLLWGEGPDESNPWISLRISQKQPLLQRCLSFNGLSWVKVTKPVSLCSHKSEFWSMFKHFFLCRNTLGSMAVYPSNVWCIYFGSLWLCHLYGHGCIDLVSVKSLRNELCLCLNSRLGLISYSVYDFHGLNLI